MAEIYRYDCVTSTSDVLKALANEGADEGTVVIARSQTAGRGRMGRSFHSPEGKGIYLSMLLKPQTQPELTSRLTAWTAVAVCRAVKELTGRDAQIKWVNDLILEGKKICGILTGAEFSPTESRVIIGVGLNVLHGEEDFPEELRQKAGSLLSVTGKEISLDDAERCLIAHLTKLKEDWPEKQEEYLAFYAEHCLTVGCEVQLTDGTLGTALAIGDDFSLTVRCADGTIRAVRSGEASVRAATGEYI